MNHRFFGNALVCVAAFVAVWLPAVGEGRKAGTEMTEEVVDATDENGNPTNTHIEKWCEPSDEPCGCRASLGSTPENGCVHLNIDLGRTRYSALTESIRLQFNELSPNSALYSPSGFRVVAGFAVRAVSRDKNSSGAPKYVTLTSPDGVSSTFKFENGESVAKPLGTIDSLADDRLAMVDAHGWATASDPAFYDYYTGDGARWRFGAAKASPDYMQFVEHQTPEGRVETKQDMGLEIIKDAEGVLKQVVTPAWVADFKVVGQDAHDLWIYPNDASCVQGTRTPEGFYAIADGAEPDVVWEFRNPDPGVMRDLLVTQRRGTFSQTWRYNYKADVRDFTLIWPENMKEERLEQYFSNNEALRVVRRTVAGKDGGVTSVKEKHFVKNLTTGDSKLAKTVSDPDGLKLTASYSYYDGGTADGLPKLTVYENGSWLRHEYDDQGRKAAHIRPWLDASTNAPVNQCAVMRYGYEFVDASDFLRVGDKRPRTVIDEICGVEVSRTYHAYPTNALMQVQEIEERAAFPGAPYGHASNARTVKTYFAPSAVAPLAGRLSTVTYPGGKVDEYGYEYGTFNAANHAFTPAPEGGAWRETVTTSYGDNSGVQVLRVSRVWDEKGREVLNESYVEDGASFALIGWKRMTYDCNGKLVETESSDGRVESATWGENCCGKESETSAEGIITVYGYNLLKQKVSETKKGLAADGSDDIVTLFAYDLESRVLSTAITNVASGLGYVASRNSYDAVGRVTNATDRLGNATVYSYPGAGDQHVAPNGITTLTERYLDGRTKRVLENGVVEHAYAYGVNPDGTRWTLSAEGTLPAIPPLTDVAGLWSLTSGIDFPWSLSVTDPLNHLVAQHKPGFGGTVLVTSNAYDIAGNLLSSTQAACLFDGSRFTVYTSQLHSYFSDGSLFLTALDLNTNGVIDLNGPDRVTGTSTVYEKDASNVWLRVSRFWVYPEVNASAAVTTSVNRVCLTGLGFPTSTFSSLSRDSLFNKSLGVFSLSESLDIRGNATVSATIIDRAAKKVMHLSLSPTSVQPTIQTTINGLLVSAVSSDAVTNIYAYDVLAQRIAVTDGRGNTTLAVYNALGQVDYTENAVSNRTSFFYDTLGRRAEVTDALGNITHTQYDIDGRVTKTWGATYPVEYSYDEHGRMVSMKTFRDENGAGDETRWLYDNPTGLLTNKVYADGKGLAYVYTSDGKIESRLWARGVLTYYSYDAAGSLISVDYSDTTPDIAYTFDRLGRLLSAVSAVSTNLFEYSPGTLDLVAETQNGTRITRSVDTFGRSAGLGMGGNYAVTYGYDDLGRFSSVSSSVYSVSSVVNYSRLFGADLLAGYTIVSSVSNCQFQVSKNYEPHRDLITSVSNLVYRASPALISAYDYTNDALGRRVSRHDSGLAFSQPQANTFGYNQRSEVTSAVMYTNTYGYLYDTIGNGLVSFCNAETNVYVVNKLNQYSNIVVQPSFHVRHPAYDADGNMIYDGKEWFYFWNGENRLVLASNAQYVVTCVYDYQGRMILKTLSFANTPQIKEIGYCWDDYNIIEEEVVCDNFTNTTYNTWGLDLSGSLQGAGGVGGLLVVSGKDRLCFSACDANGNIVEYISSNGSLTAHREYSAFGLTKYPTDSGTDSFTLWWSSKPWCSVMGVSEYQNRRYSPVLFRWVSRDNIEEQGGQNLYGMAFNDSLNHIDVLGLNVLGEIKWHGEVSDKVWEKLNPPPKPSWAGFTTGEWAASYGCFPCGSTCKKFTINSDTKMIGHTYIKSGYSYARSARTERTVVDHEKKHNAIYLGNAWQFDHIMHSAVGECISSDCCDKMFAYVFAAQKYYENEQDYQNHLLEYEDYPDGADRDFFKMLSDYEAGLREALLGAMNDASVEALNCK